MMMFKFHKPVKLAGAVAVACSAIVRLKTHLLNTTHLHKKRVKNKLATATKGASLVQRPQFQKQPNNGNKASAKKTKPIKTL
jgi:hypothetical protein